MVFSLGIQRLKLSLQLKVGENVKTTVLFFFLLLIWVLCLKNKLLTFLPNQAKNLRLRTIIILFDNQFHFLHSWNLFLLSVMNQFFLLKILSCFFTSVPNLTFDDGLIVRHVNIFSPETFIPQKITNFDYFSDYFSQCLRLPIYSNYIYRYSIITG